MINMYQPSLGQEELDAIKRVFESNWLGKGAKTDEFVKLFASRLATEYFQGIGYSTALTTNLLTISSCTEGLFQAIDLYVNEGDEVVLPSVNFIAAANAIVSKKAIPIFCDVNVRTLNPSVEDIEKKITNKTKAVIVLHYAGVPCDIENITELCKQKNIKLIEDNANSPISRINNKNTGTFGDVGVWSFDSMKQIVMGDGGMMYCQNKADAEKFRKLTYLGLKTKSGISNNVDNKWWEFDISLPGRRSIINDIQAAMGIEQLKKIDSFIDKRKIVHDTYSKELKKLNWLHTPPDISRLVSSSYYMYHIQVEDEIDRNLLAKYLRERGIYTAFRYYPLHMVPYFKSDVKLINTEYAAKCTLCIPLHQGLSMEDVDYIINSIKKYK